MASDEADSEDVEDLEVAVEAVAEDVVVPWEAVESGISTENLAMTKRE